MPIDQQDFTIEINTPPVVTLPNTLSALILVALADLEKVEAHPAYTVYMGHWHEPIPSLEPKRDDLCGVCFAGGVMAFSLNTQINEDMGPASFPPAIMHKLYALNNLREGLVTHAYDNLKGNKQGQPQLGWPSENIVDYESNPTLFKFQMRDLASRLATAGY